MRSVLFVWDRREVRRSLHEDSLRKFAQVPRSLLMHPQLIGNRRHAAQQSQLCPILRAPSCQNRADFQMFGQGPPDRPVHMPCEVRQSCPAQIVLMHSLRAFHFAGHFLATLWKFDQTTRVFLVRTRVERLLDMPQKSVFLHRAQSILQRSAALIGQYPSLAPILLLHRHDLQSLQYPTSSFQ